MDGLLTRETRRRVAVALLVALTVVFVALAVVTSTGRLPSLDVRLSWPWLALSVVLLLAFQPAVAEIWRRVMAEAGGPLPVAQGQAIYNVSLLTRYVPTQVLMAVTRIELAQREGIPRTVTVAAFAYEFALAVGSACALSVSFVLGLDSLQDQPLRYVVLVAPVGVLLLLHPRVIDALSSRLAARLRFTPAHVTIPLRRLVLYLAVYLVAWLEAGVAIYCLARGIHAVGDPSVTALSSYAIGYAAAAIAFVAPAGLGARDVATATALATSMPFSVALTTAIAVRLVQTGIEIFYAVTTALWARRTGGRQTMAEQPSGRPLLSDG
ncbi:MAG TPA: lysylphosphatidylglycerol synthase domain-containing protein [Baekduia sp.]|uniref:lysylphosphatidylglycerol synthase domain-containing protein n=1 Tax=Baekduia sp. TaxID=2600305 RepID=UPI002CC0EDD9|nr:lysylphosphatidylglycerol synthase domain-containing protein [Baekduia sp.]HMJ36405.1 lysylphosphatidylglycerol synthase domain-containing protein [Baekduia sp.]